MPYPIALRSLLEERHGAKLPDQLFEEDPRLMEARRDYRRGGREADMAGTLSRAASGIGSFQGKQAKSDFTPQTEAMGEKRRATELGMAEKQYSMDPTVSKYLLEKEKKKESPWKSTNQLNRDNKQTFYRTREDGELETRTGLEIQAKPSKFADTQQQEYVRGLSKQIASRTGVVAGLDAEINSFRQALKDGRDDLAIVKGQNMLKILNSTEGKDAVGVEEAKRLAGFLEFQLFNLTGPEPFFGRDLEQFLNQTSEKSNDIKTSIMTLKKQLRGVQETGQMPDIAPIAGAGPSEREPAPLPSGDWTPEDQARLDELEAKASGGR